ERDIQHDGDRAFAVLRSEAADVTIAVRHAEEWLDSNPERVARAALVHDGFLTWEGVRREALYSRIVEYRRPRRSLDIVVPYSRTTGVLALHRPKLFRPVGLPENLLPVVRAFYRGVDSHEEGSRCWTRSLDQSA